jgi:transcriptional regulator with XRE-family HTH domain
VSRGVPITAGKQAEIVELARSGLSRNAVARKAGVSPSTVSRIAAAEGVTFSRARTVEATRAKVADAKARRAVLSVELLDDVAHARGRLRGQGDAQSFMYAAKALSALVSAHARLAAIDPREDGIDEAKSMLGRLLTQLQVIHPEPPAVEGDAA